MNCPSPDDHEVDRMLSEGCLNAEHLGEKTINKVNDTEEPKCRYCGVLRDVTFCRHCGQDFCKNHSSKYNSLICQDCVTAANLGILSEPLQDEEGVTHQGRKIRLIGEGWPNSLRYIKDLSDSELEAEIASLQALLEEAIKTADFARISIAAREFDRDYRSHSRYVAAVKRREKIQQGAVRLNSKQHRVGEKQAEKLGKSLSLSAIEALAKSLNIDLDTAKVLMASLEAKKKS
jgi:hypothetical protein